MIPKIFGHKIYTSRQKLLKKLQALKSEGKTIVLTNGCFDLLHRGHITYLREVSQVGDVLVVALNSDESVKVLGKGPGRPIYSLEDRLILMASLEFVDYVTFFEEKTPIETIKILKPDIHVKGGDYTREGLPETPVVEEYGGRVEIINIKERSTTEFVNKIQEASYPKELVDNPNSKYYRQNDVMLQGKNILVYQSPGIGDLIMTTPAIRAIKKVAPDSKITLLTSTSASKIVPFIPEIDDVIVFDTPWELVDSLQTSVDVQKAIQNIRKRHFDMGIIFTNYDQSSMVTALLLFLADVPRRVGYSEEYPFQLMTDWIPDPEPRRFVRHGVVRALELVRMIGADISDPKMSLQVPKGAKQRIQKILRELGVDEKKPLIVYHTTTNDVNRQYSPEGFIQAGKMLRDKGYQLLLTGVSKELEFVSFIHSKIGKGSFSLVGKISLPEQLALIKMSDVMVSNNTGPAHMAAALNTPLVDLYARTNPQHIPWNVPNKVLYFDIPVPVDKSMEQVPPQMIVDSVEELCRVKSYHYFLHHHL